MKFLFLFFAVILFASTTLKADEKANEILNKVTKATESYKSITADFQFIMSNVAEDIEEVNSGNIIIQKDQFKLNLMGAEIYYDGEKQYTFMPDDNSVTVSIPDPEEEMINPAKIFTIYKEGYTNSFVGDVVIDGIKMHQIQLIPDEELEYTKVSLFISYGDFQIQKAIMHGVDGNDYIVKVTKFQTTENYPLKTFKFDIKAHEGVDVLEM